MKKNNFLIYAFLLFFILSCSRDDATSEPTKDIEKGLSLTDEDKIGLIWSEEFEGNALNTQVWGYDIGDGSALGIPGWGNQEVQTYTASSKNIKVSNGYLTISALKESIEGKNYSSARIKSQNKYAFKHGKLKIRAKFPQSKGTWPALWLMGANLDAVGWPNCGEIDLVEQNGQEKDKMIGTVHWKNTSNNTNAKFSQEIISSGIGADFKEYSLIWSESTIKMYVENVKYFDINVNASMPFNQDFFLLINIAMGGSLGGAIATDFNNDQLVVDYIRLYED